MPRECKYSNGVITCTKEFNITKDMDIEAEFCAALSLIIEERFDNEKNID